MDCSRHVDQAELVVHVQVFDTQQAFGGFHAVLVHQDVLALFLDLVMLAFPQLPDTSSTL